MLKLVAICFSALMFACGASDSDTVAPATLVLTPTTASVELVRAAAERWTAATGVVIEIGEGGVPVSFEDNTFSPRGQNCAVTESTAAGTVLSVKVDATPPAGKCREALDTLTHEIGHALCHHYDAQAWEGCHTESGLMKSGGTSRLIDEPTLSRMCESVPCATFQPEAQ